MDELKILIAARDLIEEHGLSKTLYASDKGFCTLGAMFHVDGYKTDLSGIIDVFCSVNNINRFGYGYRPLPKEQAIYRWNDDESTSCLEVLDAYDRTIEFFKRKAI